MEEIELYLEDAKESMAKTISAVGVELTKIRAGKASPDMLLRVSVDYYGSITPLTQVASVNTPDARTLVVKPWEKGMLREIERALINSDLGLNPQNDGEIIRLSVPPLTEERRMDLAKKAKAECENGKVRLRTIRKDTNGELKKLLKDGASEDMIKDAEDTVQKLTDAHSTKLDDLYTKKEKDILTV